ncbi:MAG: hypothetical protein OEY89_06300 [Gammaproteobacteria bacterium]|nr:hypothetical protein [Gammaproteobacteria bacterium]
MAGLDGLVIDQAYSLLYRDQYALWAAAVIQLIADCIFVDFICKGLFIQVIHQRDSGIVQSYIRPG